MLDLYFNSFFENQEEKSLFLTSLNNGNEYNYINNELSEWLKVEQDFKDLLPYGNLNEFHIEINKSASVIIDKIFERYVDEHTFVVSVLEHETIIKNVEKLKNVMVLEYDILEGFYIDRIIENYKNSHLNKMFIFAASVIQSNVIPQKFYEDLKIRLINENIPHTFVLDDVHGMFVVPRNYDIFDSVIFTCHAILPRYDSGIILSKTMDGLGFKDVLSLRTFVDIVKKIVISKNDKFLLFNFMIKQYLIKELQHLDKFGWSNDSAWNTVFLCVYYQETREKIIDKYKEELSRYSIHFCDNTFVIKANFVLQLEPNEILEGFDKLKKVLNKCIRFDEERLS